MILPEARWSGFCGALPIRWVSFKVGLRFGRIWAGFGNNIGQSLTNSDGMRSNLIQRQTTLDRSRANLGGLGNVTDFGKTRANNGHIWTDVGQLWPIVDELVRFWQMPARSGLRRRGRMIRAEGLLHNTMHTG